MAGPRDLLIDALAVPRQLEDEPGMRQLLQQAKGVLIAPSYGQAAIER